MTGFRACLIDVYDTVLSCDFAAHRSELPVLAGVEADEWHDAFVLHAEGLGVGRTNFAEVFENALRSCGREPDPAVVRQLVQQDRELLNTTAQLHADAVPLLTSLRARGIATAFVSNCSENTRGLLDHLGLSQLVDALVLSCEVGSAKPDAGIFQAAVAALDVALGDAVFVDDQPAFCAGAAALGITAVRIDRTGAAAKDGEIVITSLAELDDYFPRT
jgi:putative hydrolase of the HAD superfamily